MTTGGIDHKIYELSVAQSHWKGQIFLTRDWTLFWTNHALRIDK